MKSTSTLFSSFKRLKSQAKSSPTSSSVTPWPNSRSSFDGWLAGELDALRFRGIEVGPSESSSSIATWFMGAVDVAIDSQKIALELFTNSYCKSDRKAIENHVEDVVELLDACNNLREKIETIRNYIDLMKTVAHWLDGNSQPSTTAVERVAVLLDSCERSEKKFGGLEKCLSNLSKLAVKGSCAGKSSETALEEILSGSRAITVLAIGAIGIMLSFRSKRGLPVTKSCEMSLWSNSLNDLRKEMKEGIENHRKSSGAVLDELRDLVTAGKRLREMLNSQRLGNKDVQRELKVCVEELRRDCGETEKGIIDPLEGRIDDLYKNLIGVRIALLDVLSQPDLNFQWPFCN